MIKRWLLVASWRLTWGAALIMPSLPLVAAEAPLPVKVVIVTMFEIGTDDDAQAGEFQLWKERRQLDQVLPLLQQALQQRGLTIGLSERTMEITT